MNQTPIFPPPRWPKSFSILARKRIAERTAAESRLALLGVYATKPRAVLDADPACLPTFARSEELEEASAPADVDRADGYC